ncbi:MAG: 3-oxoacyl-ACP reductase FabG [Candidatus Hadarchaeota archaeon]
MPKLVAYSIVHIPPPPFKSTYAGAIVEDEGGNRLLAKIENKYFNALKIGLEGKIERRKTDFGEFDFFIPETREKKEITKVALVTGSCRGIGKAIALELASKGFNIVVNDLAVDEDAQKTVDEIKRMGRDSVFIGVDVSKYESVDKMVKESVEKLGRVDVLVNNAGITIDKLLVNMAPDQWQKVIDIDLTGVYNCTRAVLPYMIQQGGGKIVNVSSMSALDGAVGQANYAAAKGGIISFTKVIAREYAQYNVLCNAIAPGFIKTRMTDAMPPGMFKDRLAKNLLGRRGEPEEVAKLVRFLVTEADYITGQVININAGEYV